MELAFAHTRRNGVRELEGEGGEPPEVGEWTDGRAGRGRGGGGFLGRAGLEGEVEEFFSFSFSLLSFFTKSPGSRGGLKRRTRVLCI